ncbi:MAG: DUF948 domain-containing protein [Lachnospiraceae bacterium]|nr:DUF948 domain-containing protein [Lachnospiraceae bacterium]
MENGNEELMKYVKKQVFYARLAAVFTGALFVIFAIALVILVPRISHTLAQANLAISNANKTLEEIDAMSESITQTSKDLNKLVGDNADKLTESVERLSSIDFEGINVATQELQDAVGPLAEAMNRMSAMFSFGR